MVPFTLATAVMTFIWPFVSGKGGYIAIAILYGFVLHLHASSCLSQLSHMLAILALRQAHTCLSLGHL